jgi:hypothetical protein
MCKTDIIRFVCSRGEICEVLIPLSSLGFYGGSDVEEAVSQ